MPGLVWANPAALWGLALLAIPVLIHLLLRPEILRLRFPSLRFLPASRLASVRRRRIHDWPLLLVRLAIINLAVLALAGPILVTPSRERAWASQVARAIVVDTESHGADSAPGRLRRAAIDEARDGAAVSTVIEATRVADGLAEAAAWLDAAPPGGREVVMISAFQTGTVSARDLDVMSPGTGLRVVALPVVERSPLDVRRLSIDGVTPIETRHTLTVADGRPSLSRALARSDIAPLVTIEATEADSQLLQAAVNAVLADGLLVEGDTVPVALTWTQVGDSGAIDVTAVQSPSVRLAFDRFVETAGALPSLTEPGGVPPWVPIWAGRLVAAEQQGRLVILGRGALDVDDALRVARAALRATHTPPRVEAVEPRIIPAETRDAWVRAAAPADAAAVARAGETDARVLWAAVLLLLGLEQWMRRARTPGVAPAESRTEARVA